MKKVGLICVTRSNSQKLLVTLNSIFRNTSPDLYDLFLIDNESHDETLNIYSLALPENITIVRSNKNLNWVGGINLGIALTQDYEYVGFLNDDIDVGPNWLLNLVDLLDCNADLGAVGPLTSNTRDWQGYDRVRETFADLNLQPLDHISRNNVLEMYSAIQGNVPVIRVVGMLAFFCVLIRRKVVEKIGSLDPAFNELFLGDDDDYCRRMQAAGFGLALALRTYVWHASGSSSLNIADFERRQKMAADLLLKKQNISPSTSPVLNETLNILLIRRAAIGDVIMLTGVVRELKKIYGDKCCISVKTDKPLVFQNNPFIAKASSEDYDLSKYDVIYNLDDAYEANPSINFVDNYFYRVFGCIKLNKQPEIYALESDYNFVKNKIYHINNEFIVIHARQWYWEMKNIPLGIWSQILAIIAQKCSDLHFVFIGGPEDGNLDFPNAHDMRGLSLQQNKCLLEAASAFVGPDSAPFHIAATTKVPIVVLLSHLKPKHILPYRNGEFAQGCDYVQANVPCVGCYERQARPVRNVLCESGDYVCRYAWEPSFIADKIIAATRPLSGL